MAASFDHARAVLEKGWDSLILDHTLEEPLIEDTESSLFFGSGLCTRDTLSVGLPFDFLSYLYCSRKDSQAA